MSKTYSSKPYFLYQRWLGALWLASSSWLLVACSTAPAPQWQGTSAQASQRGVQAYLVGMAPVARLEFERARSALSSTANLEAVAALELLQCAARTASLEGVDCKPSIDASAMSQAQLVYRDYLNGSLPSAEQRALLPAAQQRMVAAIQTGGSAEAVVRDLVQAANGSDMGLLSALLACAIAQQHQLAPLGVATQAVELSSAQGWRKPLLAWLKVQATLAEQDGNNSLALESRQRIALLLGQ